MSKDEIEKLVNRLVRDKELSEDEGNNLKKEIVTVTASIKNWTLQNIDRRIAYALDMMNLASTEQIVELSEKVEILTQKVKDLEKS